MHRGAEPCNTEPIDTTVAGRDWGPYTWRSHCSGRHSLTSKGRRLTRQGSIILVAGLILSACSTLDRGMEAWEGHPIGDLVASWGEPTSRAPLGNGVEAYTWILDAEDCQQTFTVRDGKIIGTSDTDCSG